jgi:predicted DNA-binding transcriptional regulator AlpA
MRPYMTTLALPTTAQAFEHDIEPLLTSKEVAKILGLRAETLENWRIKGRGPRFVALGRKVAYRPCVVRAWIEQNEKISSKRAEPNNVTVPAIA